MGKKKHCWLVYLKVKSVSLSSFIPTEDPLIRPCKLSLKHLCFHHMVNGEQAELLLNLAYYIRHKFANEKIIGVTPGTFPLPSSLFLISFRRLLEFWGGCHGLSVLLKFPTEKCELSSFTSFVCMPCMFWYASEQLVFFIYFFHKFDSKHRKSSLKLKATIRNDSRFLAPD